MIRLNKFLAHAGVGSRRHCDELIAAGRVTVNRRVTRELGTQIDPEKQEVSVDNVDVKVEKHVHWIVNKPRGVLCTNYDPDGRPIAGDLMQHVAQRIYTVGRLDEDSEGLLLMTNDGELAYRLMHPRFGVEKTYFVLVAGSPSRADQEQLLKGVFLSDGHVHARRVKRIKRQGEATWMQIVLAEGKNREIRRMLARLGHKVLRLKRTAIGPIHLGRLSAGNSRRLRTEEVEDLRLAATRMERRKSKEPNPT